MDAPQGDFGPLCHFPIAKIPKTIEASHHSALLGSLNDALLDNPGKVHLSVIGTKALAKLSLGSGPNSLRPHNSANNATRIGPTGCRREVRSNRSHGW